MRNIVLKHVLTIQMVLHFCKTNYNYHVAIQTDGSESSFCERFHKV